MTAERFRISADSTIVSTGARAQNAAVLERIRACVRELRSVHAGQGPEGESRPLVYCHTSGSAGRRRIIRRSQASWIASFEIACKVFGLNARDTYAVPGDPGHSLALYAILEALHLGADLLALAGDSPKTQAQALEKARASILYATPAQLRLLLAGAQAAGITALPQMRAVFSGGGKLDPACRSAFATLCPNADIREFYGASETSFITLSDAATPAGSVGRAYPGVTIEIRASDGRPASGDGEIWVASPYLFDGYEGGPQPDTRREGDFLTIGETGHLDTAGNLFLHGRKTRMVTVADSNVFPEDVESVMLSDPAVRLCAAIGAPDRARGRVIVGFVEGPADAELALRLQRACRKALGANAAPKRIVFVDEIPMLAAGKPDLASLAQRLDAAP